MKRLFVTALLALVASAPLASAPALAQMYPPPPYPVYNSWQAQWDRYQFDRRHVVLGTVTGFSPYRLQIQRRDGAMQNVDLKNGTVIRPTGATPQPGERVAMIGYYSRGTFIVNRLILRG